MTRRVIRSWVSASHRFCVCLLVAWILFPRDAHATFHLVKITEVFVGTPAAPNAQYIVLQAYANGENLVNGHAIRVFNSAGVLTNTFTFSSNVANGVNQDRILIATPEAVAFFSLAADLSMTPVLLSLGGKICFDTTNIDCVAWGNYSRAGGDSTVGTPFGVGVGIVSGKAIKRRLDIAGNPLTLDSGDDTNNSANDWVAGLPAPINNARVNGTVPTNTCGNNTLEGLEGCEDGNITSGDGCSATCVAEFCGDTITNNNGETCDDGNSVSGDGCDANCKVTGCGSGIRTGAEVCDDGNLVSGDGCDSNCTVTACGNGVKTGTETCDDGNLVSGDGCDANCKVTACGNGIRTGAEVCDDGNAVSGDGCDANCTTTACGNGIVTAGEACEPPNVGTCSPTCQLRCVGDCSDNDPCTTNERCVGTNCVLDPTPTDDQNQCTADSCGPGGVVHVPLANGSTCDRDQNAATRDLCQAALCKASVCGDLFVDSVRGEACDDGNQNDVDACRNNCTAPSCGDSSTDAFTDEDCDDGNTNNDDSCRNNCTAPRCGDGILDIFGSEQCDDGNTNNLDDCRNNCMPPRCGDGILDSGEMCDDGNREELDACRNGCVPAFCGDEITDSNEQCDDGNLIETDGCRQCMVPRCGDGFVDIARAEACDDGNTVNDDACRNGCVLPACGDAVLDLSAGEQCDDGNEQSSDGCSTQCLTEEVTDGCGCASDDRSTPLLMLGLMAITAVLRRRRIAD
jgi:cysteine-rich repeat protein